MQYDPYTDLVIKSQPYYPKRRITEVRIPLPLKEIEYSDKPFGTTELEPQYIL